MAEPGRLDVAQPEKATDVHEERDTGPRDPRDTTGVQPYNIQREQREDQSSRNEREPQVI